MFKLIIFHPGIGIKQKLYLIFKYCIFFYYHMAIYFIEDIIRLYLSYLNDISIKLENYNRQKSWSKNTGKDILKDFNNVYKDIIRTNRSFLKNTKKNKKAIKKINDSLPLKIMQKEKDQLYQHLIDNPLGFKQANEILKIAGILSQKGIYLNDLFNKDFSINKFRVAHFWIDSENRLNILKKVSPEKMNIEIQFDKVEDIKKKVQETEIYKKSVLNNDDFI